MRLVSWNWFWYVLMGFLMGGGAVYLRYLIRDKSLKLVWYEWGLISLAFVTFMFMGQTFIACFGEGEPRAAWMTLLFMGVPIMIMAVLTAGSVRRRQGGRQGKGRPG